ncbi:D-alanyl-D-alanine carboxypeptidase family protein [Haloimpatiens lingqiaonensis]|uniref:D-alanyl-D-alanine carboxypeptidase family protein n=1 Tax=Haloimpatiens lingqiaonensis TaxID=1380675 RepID=UPI0010FE9DA3|nr:D-alanyl-D-alanine carboxypeptidase family protein [Haloimpatiens lingqiaonensis]
MKKFLISLVTFFLIFCSYAKASTPTQPAVSADGAIVLDANSGRILYSKNIDTPYAPASTTKIMTALLTLENCKLNDMVTVGKKPPVADGSKIYIFEGEKLTVEQLLYGLLLASANDCAEALAEHIGGSIDGFSQMMNRKAKELGCKNTNFVNPSGLYDDKHRTSARDLALIMKELVKQPEYSKIAKTSSYKIPPTNVCKEERPLWNENKLVQPYSKFYYNICEGGKTGYTIQSLHSYVASASKDNHRLIVALTHDNNKTYFNDSLALFKYAYENFDLVEPYLKGQTIENYSINKNSSIPLSLGENFYYTIEKTLASKASFKIEPKLNENLGKASLKKGDTIGTAQVKLDGKSIGEVKLLSGKDYTPKTTASTVLTNTVSTGKTILKYVFYVFIIILAIYIVLRIILIIKRKKRRKRFKYKK